MNLAILNKEVQAFIQSNLNSDIAKLAFKGSSFKGITIQELINQIISKQKCQEKLPTWFNTPFIYYPTKLSIEQTSSEITAKYKASLISGNSIIDVTGGFGVDSYYFSNQFNEVTHCEINKELSAIAAYNFQLLQKQISCVPVDGIDFIKSSTKKYDWIYIDPSRRNDSKGRVFKLTDCEPNVPALLDDLFTYSSNILLKLSPLLDITAVINDLKSVSDLYIVAVHNEVKELLAVLKNGFTKKITIHTINIKSETSQLFSFDLNESINEPKFSNALTYLYEPNKAIYKAGCFNLIASKFDLLKISQNTHLYTGNNLISFPGSTYKVIHQVTYNYRKLKELLPNSKAIIKIKNFKDDLKAIKKKMKIVDGNEFYLFFITDFNEKPIILITKRIN